MYIIFTIDEAKMALNCAEQKAIKLLSELEKKAGLIERKRQGLGKPNLIYVKNFISAVDGSSPIGTNHVNSLLQGFFINCTRCLGDCVSLLINKICGRQ